MSTLSDLVIETQRRVFSSMREEIDTLGANIPSGATSLTLGTGQSLGSIQPGSIIQVDWELFFVISASSSSSISVIPGFYDSVTAAHVAGALITVNPRFPVVDVIKAINQDIDSLSSPSNGLFQALEVTVNCNPVLTGYDLTDINTSQPANSGLMDILRVETHEFGPAQTWPAIPYRGFTLRRNADTSFFPSGFSLKIYDQSNYFPGQPIRIYYKAPYTTPLVNPTDDVAGVTGLHTQAHDIPVLGAVTRLVPFREIKRSFSEDQPQPRIATEVPVGSADESMKELKAQRMERINEERARLQNEWRASYR